MNLTKKDLETAEEGLLNDWQKSKFFWCNSLRRTVALSYCRLTCGKTCKQIREVIENESESGEGQKVEAVALRTQGGEDADVKRTREERVPQP